jgi:hypothetical protein
MDWWVLICTGFFAGLSVGILGMQWLFVRPLEKSVLNMRIMGFDPVRRLPQPEPEDDFPECNET